MTKYKIILWSASKLNGDYNSSPILYIKPDKSLMKYISSNNYKIKFKIINTNSVYDNQMYSGIVSTSEQVPCYRPNYFEQTGQYVITLDAYWKGFPPRLGYILIEDILSYDTDTNEKHTILEKYIGVTENIDEYKNEDINKSKNKFKIKLANFTLFLVTILVFFPLIFLFFMYIRF